jgi:hypothetical protein
MTPIKAFLGKHFSGAAQNAQYLILGPLSKPFPAVAASLAVRQLSPGTNNPHANQIIDALSPAALEELNNLARSRTC